jgi:phosphonate transport system ATP-binding protein
MRLAHNRAMHTNVIELRNVSKTFRAKRALDDVSFDIERTEMVALLGPSGSGKSTLIRMIGGLETVDASGNGTVRLLGDTVQENGRRNGAMRAKRGRVSTVFQRFNLVGRLSLLTNVLTGALGRTSAWRGSLGLFHRDDKLVALRALERVGILPYARQRASTLSGGQQQRGAIARALTQNAEVILADEPVASLDPASAERVMQILASINKEDGVTVIVSLHQVEYALKYCQRIIALRDGKLIYDGNTENVDQSFFTELYGGSIHPDEVDEAPVERPHPVMVGEPEAARMAG